MCVWYNCVGVRDCVCLWYVGVIVYVCVIVCVCVCAICEGSDMQCSTLHTPIFITAYVKQVKNEEKPLLKRLYPFVA